QPALALAPAAIVEVEEDVPASREGRGEPDRERHLLDAAGAVDEDDGGELVRRLAVLRAIDIARHPGPVAPDGHRDGLDVVRERRVLGGPRLRQGLPLLRGGRAGRDQEQNRYDGRSTGEHGRSSEREAGGLGFGDDHSGRPKQRTLPVYCFGKKHSKSAGVQRTLPPPT